MAELRAYGIEDIIYFPLIDFGDTDFEKTPVSFELGDSQISIDGIAFENTANLPSYVGNGMYGVILTASEHSCKKIILTIIDQSGTPLWEDQAVYIETVGHLLSQHPGIGPGTGTRFDSITLNLANMYTLIQFLVDMEEGDWELKEPNQLVYYLKGSATIIAQWNCFDINGDPSITNIAKIVRI